MWWENVINKCHPYASVWHFIKTTRHKEQCKWKALQTTGSFSGSSPSSGCPAKMPHSPPRMAGSSSPSPPTKALDHGCVFDMWLLITCTSSSQETRPLSLHPEITLNLGLQRLRSAKSPSKCRTCCTLFKVHHLHSITGSNCLKPTTEVLSAQEPQSQHPTSNLKIFVLTRSRRRCSHLLPW